MAKLYPTIYASVLCLALIFIHTGEGIDCRRTATQDASATRKTCIQAGTGGCGQAYQEAFFHHQRTCAFQVGRRSADLGQFLEETHAQDSPAIENNWRNTNEDTFNALMNRLRNVAAEVEEEEIPLWLQEAEDAELESPHVVSQDSIQRLLARL